MRKIKDRIILGALCGIIAATPIQLINVWAHKKKITDVSYSISASKVFLPKNKIKTPGANGLSALVNYTNAGFTGVLLTYVLSLTGKDKAIIKGAGIGTVFWVLVEGLISNKVFDVRSKKPLTPFIGFFQHVAFGALSSFLITKLGDERLFPNKKVANGEKIPVIHTGNSTEERYT